MKILHLFQWKLTDITKVVAKVKEQGFDAIQISPIQGTKDSGNEWWKLYQPTNLKIGNTQIGSKEDLINLCNEAKKHDIKIIVDIVLRHCAGDENNPLQPHRSVDPSMLQFLKGIQEPLTNEDNRYQITHNCTGMPMYDYNNNIFKWRVLDFLNELIACGVYGFRLDQLKHFALPFEGCDFIPYISHYKIYGECIFCEQSLLDEYTKYMGVLTEGRPKDTSKLVAKFESHDDYLHFKTTCRMSDHMRLTEWDILVNKCGYTALYYARPFETLWMSPEMKAINERGKICTR